MDERVFQKLGFDKIRERLQAKTLSAPGAELAITLQPSGEPAAVANLLKETAEAEHIAMASVAYPMMGFDDIKEELGRLRAGAALSCAELLRVCRLHKAAKRAYKGIQPEAGQVERLSEMAKDLWYDDILISRIEQAILSEEEVADNASPTLRDIRRKIKSENAAIREKLNSILRSKEKAAYLQEGIVTMREGRFVIPVKQEYRAQIPGLVESFKPIIERNLNLPDMTQQRSWFYLSQQAPLAVLVSRMLYARATGNEASMKALWEEVKATANRLELTCQSVFEAPEFIRTMGRIFRKRVFL